MKLKNAIYFLGVIVLLLGIVFKIQHYPGAGIMITITLTIFAIAFLKFAYDIRKSLFVPLPILFSISLISALFKIQHWPFPNYISDISGLLFIVITPIVFIKRGISIKKDFPKISPHLVTLGTLFALITIEYIIILIIPDIFQKSTFIKVAINIIIVLTILIVTIKTLRLKNLKEQLNDERKILIFFLTIMTITAFAIPVSLLFNSKSEISDSFQLINKGLEKTSENYKSKNDLLFENLLMDTLNSSLNKEQMNNVLNIKHQITSLEIFIEKLKIDIINESGGKNNDGNFRNPENINPSNKIMLIEKNAYELQRRIIEIKNEMLNIIEENDRKEFENKIIQITNNPTLNANQDTISWAEYYFGDLPAIASVTMLSKIEIDMKHAETEVFEYLLKHTMDTIDRNRIIGQ